MPWGISNSQATEKGDLERRMQQRRRSLIGGLVFALGLAYFGFFVDYGINFADEGALLSQMSRLADGEVPWVDFHIGYTPGVYYSHAFLMRLFDHSIMPGRWLLVAVISATMALLYFFTLAVSGRSWVGLLPSFIYLATIPIHAGNFASSNIPYPVWYVVLFWVAGFLCLFRFGHSQRYRWLWAGSLFAGLNFLFKPNVGLFHLAAASFVCLAIIPLQDDGTWGWRRRLNRGLWWAWWLGVLLGLALVFSGRAGAREMELFLLPVSVSALVVLWRSAVVPATTGHPRVLPCAAILGGGFLAVNVPWLAWAHHLLGTQRFLERVLFFGADFEKFYFIAHPPVLGGLLVGLAAVVLLVAAPTRLRGSRLSPQLAMVLGFIASAAGLYAAVRFRPMPQGFFHAVMSEFEFRVFAATQLIHWLGLWIWMRSIGTTREHRGPSLNLCVLCVGALFLYLQLYPRTDFMHWVTAAPMSAALAAYLIGRLSEAWSSERSGMPRWVIPAILVSPMLFVGSLRMHRAINARIDMVAGRLQRAPEVRLANSRAPVSINVGRAGDYGELSALLNFLDEATVPGERIFTFPSLDIVSYLSGRNNPTRHGYFFPGWPGHEVEAEVIAALETTPPRFVVVRHWHPLFFARASLYYYALDDFIEQNYRQYARFGSYLVFAHRSTGPDGHGPQLDRPNFRAALGPRLDRSLGDALTSPRADVRLAALSRLESFFIQDDYPPLLDMLSDPDQQVRDGAVRALQFTRSARGAYELFATAARGALSPRETMMALRVAGAVADSTSGPLVLGLLDSPVPAVSQAALFSLRNISGRGLNSSYWFGLRADTDRSVAPTRLEEAQKLRLLSSLSDPTALYAERLLAIVLSKKLGLKDCDERLRNIAAEAQLHLRVRAMLELSRQGCGSELLQASLNVVAFDEVLGPRIVRPALRRSPKEGDLILSEFIDTTVGAHRVALLWIAATVGGARSADSAAAALSSTEATERLAAAWVLGRIGVKRHEFLLERAAESDPDVSVREMASWALAAMQIREERG